VYKQAGSKMVKAGDLPVVLPEGKVLYPAVSLYHEGDSVRIEYVPIEEPIQGEGDGDAPSSSKQGA